MEIHLLLQWYNLERLVLLPRLRTLYPAAPLERDLPERNIMLLPHQPDAYPGEGRAILCMLLRLEHHVHDDQFAKTWEAVPATREAVPRNWQEVAVVLDAGRCSIWDYQCFYGSGCRSILCV